MTNLSSSLAGLSLLSGSNSFADYASTATVESRAIRLAKAQFTATAVTPPWKLPASKTAASLQVSAIQRLPSIVDKPIIGSDPAQRDIQTNFVAYKALDRLRLLAETAAAKTTGSAQRLALNASFAKGLDDLQDFLAQAPTDKVELAFETSSRRAESVALQAPDAGKAVGKGVAPLRTAAVAGLTGDERFSIRLDRGSVSDTVTIDLAQTPQPPTIDSIAAAANAAIAAIPKRDANGVVVLDAEGAVVPKWQARFGADKSTGSWGLTLTAPISVEKVSIDQIGAGDALLVATGFRGETAAAGTQLLRFNDPAGTPVKQTLGTIVAVDRAATATAQLTAPKSTVKTIVPPPVRIAATVAVQASVADASGNLFVVGTTGGDIGSDLGHGATDLFLSKFDSEGGLVWRRSLGAAGAAQGAAIALAPGGGVVVAGSVSGSFGGAELDGDLLVARYDAEGDESFATVVKGTGADVATAVAVAADGTIYLGGRTATGGGDAFLARLDTTGKVAERRTIDNGGRDGVKALAIGAGGGLLAVVDSGGSATLRGFAAGGLATDTGSIALGVADVRAIAVAADGRIALGGATLAPIAGAQTNAITGSADGFVTRVDSALSTATTTYVGSAGSDGIDSIAFLGDQIYAGGRTTGNLGGPLTGSVDGFVARLGAADGAVSDTRQFGSAATVAQPVLVAAAEGGNSALGALGLHRGTLNSAGSARLVAQSSLRAGDEFTLRIAGGLAKKIVIAADDTAATLAARITKLTGRKVLATASKVGETRLAPGETATTLKPGEARVLRLQATANYSIELVSGADGKDALAKLGIAPQRLSVPVIGGANEPKVRPGGTFSLGLTRALSLVTPNGAAVALTRIKGAITTAQGAFRSLFWDDGKVNLVNGYAGVSAGTAAQQAQLAGYREALARLTPSTDGSSTYTGF